MMCEHHVSAPPTVHLLFPSLIPTFVTYSSIQLTLLYVLRATPYVLHTAFFPTCLTKSNLLLPSEHGLSVLPPPLALFCSISLLFSCLFSSLTSPSTLCLCRTFLSFIICLPFLAQFKNSSLARAFSFFFLPFPTLFCIY